MTPAEKAFALAQELRKRKMAEKMVEKSHIEKLQEMNAKLALLTEHHDIPKVGPG